MVSRAARRGVPTFVEDDHWLVTFDLLLDLPIAAGDDLSEVLAVADDSCVYPGGAGPDLLYR